MSGNTTDDAGQGTPSFETALSGLDREGSNVLVVGAVPDSGTAAACRQLFGEPGPDQRRLLVYARDGDLDVRRRLYTGPAGPRPGRFEVVRDVIPSRRAAVARSEPRAFETWVTSDRLSALGRTVSDRLLQYDQEQDRSSVDIRVCFDSLAEILAEHETEPVFRFINMMIGQIRNVGGLGQFHLPIPRDSEQVSLLAGLFDAVVELRLVDGEYQQRWHLEDGDVVSDWHPL